MCRLLFLFTLATLSQAFAPAPLPKPDTSAEDLKQMQGTWRRLSCTNGSFPPVAKPLNDFVLISGNRITYDLGKGFPPWVMKLGTGKAPRTFDIKRVDGGPGCAGLYELRGDTLRVCFAPGSDRPRSMQPSKEGESLQVFKRQRR